jgi:hypothetical protein
MSALFLQTKQIRRPATEPLKELNRHVMTTAAQLRIAVLDCDTPVPNVYAERGLYSDIFEVLLKDAATKTPGLPRLDLRFASYDTVLGQYPSEEELLHIDAIIITGSGVILPGIRNSQL